MNQNALAQEVIGYGRLRIDQINKNNQKIDEAAKLLNEIASEAGFIGLGCEAIHKLTSKLDPVGAEFVYQVASFRLAKQRGWY